MEDIDRAAKIIWNYMLMGRQVRKSDIILGLGSIDERVAVRSAQLFNDGLAELLVFSGGIAHKNDLLATQWDEDSEAEHFAAIAKNNGVPENKILLETEAQNTGDNAEFTEQLLGKKSITVRSMIVVTKPYMERRAYATFKKQWQSDVDLVVTSPQIHYEDYFNEQNPKERIVNVMVGDLQRIKEFPAKGFQIEQDIPDDVRAAWEKLVSAGYDKHLLQ